MIPAFTQDIEKLDTFLLESHYKPVKTAMYFYELLQDELDQILEEDNSKINAAKSAAPGRDGKKAKSC